MNFTKEFIENKYKEYQALTGDKKLTLTEYKKAAAKASTAAFKKFQYDYNKHNYKSLGGASAAWNGNEKKGIIGLTNLQKSQWVDARLKIRPLWYVGEEVIVIKKPTRLPKFGPKREPKPKRQYKSKSTPLPKKVIVKKTIHVPVSENKRFQLDSREAIRTLYEYFNQGAHQDFFIPKGQNSVYDVQMNYWFRNVEVENITENSDLPPVYRVLNYSKEFLQDLIIKGDDFNHILFRDSDEYRKNLFRDLNNEVFRLEENITALKRFLVNHFKKVKKSELKKITENVREYLKPGKKDIKLLPRNYRDIKITTKNIKENEDKLRLTKSEISRFDTLYSDKSLEKNEFYRHTNVVLSTIQASIFGAIIYYKIHSLENPNLIGKNILITNIRFETYEEEKENSAILINPVITNSFIERPNDLYGFFRKEWNDDVKEEALTYEFNDKETSLCSLSCLLYNPLFLNLVSVIENKELFFKHTIYELSGIIIFNAGFNLGELNFKLTHIKEIHHQLAIYYGIEFVVRYHKTCEKRNIKTINHQYPLINGKKKLTSLKNLPEGIQIFDVVLAPFHCFNVNSKEALHFLKDNVLGYDETSSKLKYDCLRNKDESSLLQSESYLWGKKVYKTFMSQISNDHIITHKRVVNSFLTEDQPCGTRDFIEFEHKSNISKLPYETKCIYAVMDLETFPNKDGFHTSYSMSTRRFTEERLIGPSKFSYSTKGSLSIEEIIAHFRFVANYCKINKMQKAFCFFHYGSKFDMRILEDQILTYEGVDKVACPSLNYHGATAINTENGLIHFSFKLKYDDVIFVVRDSYRLLDCAADKVIETYGLPDTCNKYDYPYAFYRKLKSIDDQREITAFSKDEMLNFMDYNQVSVTSCKCCCENKGKYCCEGENKGNVICRQKELKTKTYYKDFNNKMDMNSFKKFVNTYFKEHKVFIPEEYCETYNNQDVDIIAEALIKANQMYQNLGKESNIKSLDPDYYGKKVGKKGPYHIKTQLNILKEMTLSSFISKMVKAEGISNGTDNVLSYSCTSENGLIDLFNKIATGGMVSLPQEKYKRLFICNKMKEVVNHEAFYIKPQYDDDGYKTKNYQELLDVYSKFGYDVNKKQPNFKEVASEVKEWSEEKGFGCIIADANSLYPSSMYRYGMPIGKYQDMTLEDFKNYNYDYIYDEKLKPDEFSNYTYAAFFRYKLGECRSPMAFISIPKEGGGSYNIDTDSKREGTIALDHIKVALFKSIFKDAELEFISGVKTETLDYKLSELIYKLYQERNKYKSYSNSKDLKLKGMSVFEKIVKLILNCTYGKFKQKEHHVSSKYLSTTYKPEEYKMCKNYFQELVAQSNFIYCDHDGQIQCDSTEDPLNLIQKMNEQGKQVIFMELYKKFKSQRNQKRGSTTVKQSFYHDIKNLVHDTLSVDDLQSLGFNPSSFKCESTYDYEMKIGSGRHTETKFLDPENKCKDAYTHISSFKNAKRDHENKVDWAATVLSGSKMIMYQMVELIGQNEILYGDTDSLLCDGVHALNPEIQKKLYDQANIEKYEDNNDLGGFKSDFNAIFWDKTKLKPINKKLGLESILNIITGKKQYCNHILGWHQDGYMTISMKKRAKGINGYHVHTEDYLKMLITGKKHKQIVTDTSKFKTQNKRGMGLQDIRYQEKEVRAEEGIRESLIAAVTEGKLQSEILEYDIVKQFL